MLVTSYRSEYAQLAKGWIEYASGDWVEIGGL